MCKGTRVGTVLVNTRSSSLCFVLQLLLAACGWLVVLCVGSSGGFWVSGRTPGASLRALCGLSCLAARVVKPTREVGEPGPVRLLPAAVLWPLWAASWGCLGAFWCLLRGASEAILCLWLVFPALGALRLAPCLCCSVTQVGPRIQFYYHSVQIALRQRNSCSISCEMK